MHDEASLANQLPAADPAGASDDAPAAAINLREERIFEHIDAALKLADPLQATVDASSGELLLMHYRMGQTLEEALAQTGGSLSAIGEVLPAVNAYVKLGQQADRFLQLGFKLKASAGN